MNPQSFICLAVLANDELMLVRNCGGPTNTIQSFRPDTLVRLRLFLISALVLAPVPQTFTPVPSNIDITFGNKDVAGRGPVRTMGYLDLRRD